MEFDEYTARLAKKLSKDAPPRKFAFGYIIYANKTRWYIEAFITHKLYWISSKPVSGNLGDFESLHVTRTDEEIVEMIQYDSPEFQATWLPRWIMRWCMKDIIKYHPNMRR